MKHSYKLDNRGIYQPDTAFEHRNEEYDESTFTTLSNMQSEHFWYVGRHHFLLKALKQHAVAAKFDLKAIDLGGGVGGWISFLCKNYPHFSKLALGDSSEVALYGAQKILPSSVELYHSDLMNLGWKEEWDIIFLLDVLEHCPNDQEILHQIKMALKPGGLLIITTPALMAFWSPNDVQAKHLRRYNISDFKKLAEKTNFQTLDSRYFMFLLSPLYLLSRLYLSTISSEQKLKEAIKAEHKVPPSFVNRILRAIFLLETHIGLNVRFPWGTSLLTILKKP